MHVVQLHEIFFSYLFVWPFSILFSLLVRARSRPLRAWHVAAIVFLGPIATLTILWIEFARPLKRADWQIPPSMPQAPRGRALKVLGYVLVAGLAWMFLTGAAIFLHPGWTRFYFGLIKAHAYAGYLLWLVFLLYVWKHARRFDTSLRLPLFFVCFVAALTVTVHTLNTVSSPWLLGLSVPLLWIGWRLGKALGRAVEQMTGVVATSGIALLVMMALTFATGAYIAEPLNSLLNNNMGLYVIYIHGAVPLLLLPWLVGVGVHHIRPRMAVEKRQRVWRIVAAYVPLHLLLLCGGFLYAHWKWYGADAGPHYLIPNSVTRLFHEARKHRETFATHTGPPPASHEGTFPKGYERILDDYTVCGDPRCHQSLVEQWKYSQHRFAASDLLFRKVLERLEREKGGPELNYFCLNCHAPSLVLSPDRAGGITLDRLKTSEGITCKSCHTMTEGTRTAHPRDGSYELRSEEPYPVTLGEPGYLTAWRGYIRWDLRLHFRNYSIPDLAVTGSQCAACHVASMPTFVTGLDKNMKVADLYTSWKNSIYPAQGKTCITCHMPERSRDERGFTYPDHRMPGLNTGLPLMVEGDDETLAGAQKTAEFTKELAKGESRWPDAIPFLALQIETREEPRPGEMFSISIKTTNTGVGHYFHAGPSTLNEVWLEVEITDGTGRRIFHSGGVDEASGNVDGSAHELGAQVFDSQGNLIRDCSIWRTASFSEGRRIEPFQTVEDRYDFAIPADCRFPLRIDARWNHRRASQAFMDWVYGGKGPSLPVVQLVSQTEWVQDSRQGPG
jgi:hypothetical protein